MSDWRDEILRHFTPEIAAAARLTVVADPDQLLAEQGVVVAVRERGFDILPFDDALTFRYAYERRYRQAWDVGEDTGLVVTLRLQHDDVNSLPWDLLSRARQADRVIHVSLAGIFPRLSPPVLSALDLADLDRLYPPHAALLAHRLGDASSLDFVLRHVFGIDVGDVRSPAAVLECLFRWHEARRALPNLMLDHIEARVRDWLPGWPTRDLFADRSIFEAFLQERWPRFLAVRAGAALPDTPLSISGPPDLPFEAVGVNTHVDTWFLEGHLSPVAGPGIDTADPWMRPGMVLDRAAGARHRMGVASRSIPTENAPWRDWSAFAWTWAEWLAARWLLPVDLVGAEREEAEALHERVEEAFASWMLRYYAGLYSVSWTERPVLVHQCVRHLARSRAARRALIVVDGLALDQWVAWRDEAARDLRFEERTAFAWVPTLTSVSRLAIFSGEAPFVTNSGGEPAWWSRFWADQGARGASEVAFAVQREDEGDAALVDRLLGLADDPRVRVLGAVVGFVDRTLHGATLGTAGMHEQLRLWGRRGELRRLIVGLVAAGFELHLTSDHGNVEAHGIGRPNAGVLPEASGERAYRFESVEALAHVHALIPEAIRWPGPGLPPNSMVLLARGRGAFLNRGASRVVHGGMALEEVVVPLIRFPSVPS